jgi:2-keto-3-deoxy-L-rhamnonate aldolase RhmA
LIAGKGTETALLVRVRQNEPAHIRLPLDLGADGVMIPLVNSVDEARRAVAGAKYPPQGMRGIGAWRPSGYYADSWSYVRRANADTTVIIQIEHIRAVEALEDILQVPGIDAVFIGPADLSASLARFPDKLHPDVLPAYRQVAAVCRDRAVPFGTDGGTVMQFLAPLGARLLTTGIDTYFVMDAARSALAQAREAYAGGG